MHRIPRTTLLALVLLAAPGDNVALSAPALPGDEAASRLELDARRRARRARGRQKQHRQVTRCRLTEIGYLCSEAPGYGPLYDKTLGWVCGDHGCMRSDSQEVLCREQASHRIAYRRNGGVVVCKNSAGEIGSHVCARPRRDSCIRGVKRHR